MKRTPSPFKWRHYAPDVILLCVRWYRRYQLWSGAAQCFRTFHTAERAIEGIEALHMMRKGQVKRVAGSDAVGQSIFVESLFGIAAWQ